MGTDKIKICAPPHQPTAHYHIQPPHKQWETTTSAYRDKSKPRVLLIFQGNFRLYKVFWGIKAKNVRECAWW